MYFIYLEKVVDFQVMIKFNKNTPTLDAMERFTFSPKKSDFRDVDLELGAAEREPGADWDSLFMLFFFFNIFSFY